MEKEEGRITCTKCKRERKIYCKKLCHSCYVMKIYYKNKKYRKSVNENSKKWRKNHKEDIKKYMKNYMPEWWRKNPEKYKKFLEYQKKRYWIQEGRKNWMKKGKEMKLILKSKSN